MLIKLIYPLVLRERVFYKFHEAFNIQNDKDVNLYFGKNVKMDLLATDFGHRGIITTGFYELELSRMIGHLAAQGGVLFDVGANYGYYSCIWASLKKANKVHAFEASPQNLEPLTNNIHKNGFEDRVKLNAFAAGREKDTLRFNLATEQDQTGWGGLTLKDEDKAVEVDVDTLDNYASENNIESIQVLKIDTEGADTWVLYGAKRLLAEKRIEQIFFEHNFPRMKKLGIASDEAANYLERLDYKVVRMSPGDFHAYPN